VRQCQALVIWTDCDREGENIGFEVIDVCKAGTTRYIWQPCLGPSANHLADAFMKRVCLSVCLCLCVSVKPNLQVFRARFSEITPNSIRQACENLIEPDAKVSDAVDVRQELDLRIGTAAHTHTLLQNTRETFYWPPRLFHIFHPDSSLWNLTRVYMNAFQ